MKKSEFIKMVEDAVPNRPYELPADFRYSWFKIDKEDYGYSWTLAYNYKYFKEYGYVYPEKSNGYVMFFKTESGAKRNLINKFNKISEFNTNFFEKE